MKKIYTLLVLLLTISGHSQKTTEEVTSAKLNRTRQISISLPAAYEKDPDRKFPILVVLDAEYLFDAFSGALSYANYWDDLPPMIVVGIHQNANGERFDDSAFSSETGLPEGSGANFFEFIGAELLPAIEKKYRVAPFRIIAGHDTTAGFLNFFLYKDQPIFNAYISLSPEMEAQMPERISQRLSVAKTPIFYYQATADGDVKRIRQRVEALDSAIKSASNNNVRYQLDDFKNASHYSLVLHAIPNSLYHIFSVYQPISTSEFQEKIVKLNGGYVDYLVKKYDGIEKALGIKMPVRLTDFKAIEAAILKNNAYAEFEKLADISKKNYPKSMLSDYQLGMMYEHQNDFKKAFRHYQNAFSKNEIGDLTRDMMLEKAEEMKAKQ